MPNRNRPLISKRVLLQLARSVNATQAESRLARLHAVEPQLGHWIENKLESLCASMRAQSDGMSAAHDTDQAARWMIAVALEAVDYAHRQVWNDAMAPTRLAAIAPELKMRPRRRKKD